MARTPAGTRKVGTSTIKPPRGPKVGAVLRKVGASNITPGRKVGVGTKIKKPK